MAGFFFLSIITANSLTKLQRECDETVVGRRKRREGRRKKSFLFGQVHYVKERGWRGGKRKLEVKMVAAFVALSDLLNLTRSAVTHCGKTKALRSTDMMERKQFRSSADIM